LDFTFRFDWFVLVFSFDKKIQSLGRLIFIILIF